MGEGQRGVYLEERGGDVVRLAQGENLPQMGAGYRTGGVGEKQNKKVELRLGRTYTTAVKSA